MKVKRLFGRGHLTGSECRAVVQCAVFHGQEAKAVKSNAVDELSAGELNIHYLQQTAGVCSPQ